MLRHADSVTMDHIIELRKEIQALEKDLTYFRTAYNNLVIKQISLLHEHNSLKEVLKRERVTNLFDLGY